MPVSYSVGNSILNNTNPVIYRHGKIMYHLSLPMFDSDHYSICPKISEKGIYGQIKANIGKILRKLCEQKGIEIIEAQACPDHIYMLVSIHKQVDYGPGTLKEVTIAPKCRVDGIDFNNRIIYELKPNNPQAIARGLRQLDRYTTAASQQYGGDWTGVLKLYD